MRTLIYSHAEKVASPGEVAPGWQSAGVMWKNVGLLIRSDALQGTVAPDPLTRKLHLELQCRGAPGTRGKTAKSSSMFYSSCTAVAVPVFNLNFVPLITSANPHSQTVNPDMDACAMSTHMVRR